MKDRTYHECDVWFNYNLDVVGRTIYVGSVMDDGYGNEKGVDYTLSEFTIKGLHYLDRVKDKDITIILNNPGGDVAEGMAIYDTIKNCDNRIVIKCVGKVYSMAGYILQSADYRIMSKHCYFMLHEGYVGYSANHPRINEAWIKHDKKMDEILFDLYYKKIKEKHPRFKKSSLEEWLKFDTIFSPEECVHWNLADIVL